MKMIISIIMMAFLWVFPAQAMDGKKAESLLEVKEASLKMRRVSILGIITVCFIPKKSDLEAQLEPAIEVRSSKKKVAKKKADRPTFDEFLNEQNEMSVCLGDPRKKNLKYTIAGSSILDV